jgi:hypothetical protein
MVRLCIDADLFEETHTSSGFNTGFKPNANNQMVGAPTMDLPIKDNTPLCEFTNFPHDSPNR